jgi:hypothetical protein
VPFAGITAEHRRRQLHRRMRLLRHHQGKLDVQRAQQALLAAASSSSSIVMTEPPGFSGKQRIETVNQRQHRPGGEDALPAVCPSMPRKKR